MKKASALVWASGLILAFGGAPLASAATYTFNLSSSNPGTIDDDYSRTFQTGSLQLTATGFTDTSPSILNDNQFSRLDQFSGGIGIGGGNSPYHAMDNNNGIDYVKLAFSEEVNITNIVLGWVYNDGDLAYGTGQKDLTEVSWTGGSSDSFADSFTLTEFGDVWRIAASIADACGGCSNKDYFKIESVTVQTVPIPAAFWLFGTALLGMLGVGRMRSTAVQNA